MADLPLVCHPLTPSPDITTFLVRVERPDPARLILRFRLEGNVDALRLPPLGPARAQDGLWRSTCFEAFVRVPGQAPYLEFNASPSSAWAVYRFAGYREGAQTLVPDSPPRIQCIRHGAALDAAVDIHLDGLGIDPSGPLELGLTAVLQARGLSYWALAHAGERPDFHDPAGFTLRLPP